MNNQIYLPQYYFPKLYNFKNEMPCNIILYVTCYVYEAIRKTERAHSRK